MPDRRPVAAGRFYPGEPARLRKEVTTFLGSGKETLEPLMIMLPHAGYIFCGSVIGTTLAGVHLPPTLIVLCPNHSGRGRPFSVWPEGAWLTPLGPVETDAALAARCLEAGGGFEANTDAHMQEHSLEVILPFLQCLRHDVRIVPICAALHDMDGLRKAGEALAEIVREEREAGRQAMLLVSSDMNHFDNQENTVLKDKRALEPLLMLEPEKLFTTVVEERISMCGVIPATAALFACKTLGATKARLTAYGTSAAASGDAGRVVGYAGVHVY